MKVCFFGSYQRTTNNIPSGNGGTLLKKILETQDVEVVECQVDVNTVTDFFKAYFSLFFKHRKLKYDAMIIPWRGILTLPLAKLIHRGPIIYFPAFSIYDTLVNDRKKIRKNSISARVIHFVDKVACNISDRIVLESSEQIKYFENEFGIDKEKFRQLWLSSYEPFFQPLAFKENNSTFVVLYFGEFIPLHGVETIIEAANILQTHGDITFILCGHGQKKPEIEKLIQKNNLKNVFLPGLVSDKELLKNLKKSDLCLGIFGSSFKSRTVLTNKVFQILASQKPIITMDSPTVKEAHLVNRVNCLLVPPSSPKELSDAILFLKNNVEKRKKIAAEGYHTYQQFMSMNKVGKRFVEYMKELS